MFSNNIRIMPIQTNRNISKRILFENVAKCKATIFDDSADFCPSLLIFRRIVIFLYT